MVDVDWKKLRGLKKLVHDGVREGASFVEKHHRHAASKPFDIIESIDPIAAPTKLVRTVHDGILTTVYESIRGINDVTEQVDDWVVDNLEAASPGGDVDDAANPPAPDDETQPERKNPPVND